VKQQPLFLPETPSWTPPSDFPRWHEAKRLTIDLETRDDSLKKQGSGSGWFKRDEGHYVTGIAIQCEEDARYYPIAHAGGGNLPREAVVRWLKDTLNRTDAELVFHHCEYDLGFLRTLGIEPNDYGKVRDTSKAAPLLDENRAGRGYGLDAVARDWVGVGKDDSQLSEYAKQAGLNPKSDMWMLPASVVARYAEQDVKTTTLLWEYCEPEIRSQGLWEVFELEASLAPCLIDMKAAGVRVDLPAADLLRAQLAQQYTASSEQQVKDWGRRVSPNSPKQIASMCDSLNIKYPTTLAGNASFKGDWLERHHHPFLTQIVSLRRIKTMQSLLEGIIYDHTYRGRIHGNFNPLKSDEGGTVGGRFSASGPNLQQVPERDPVWGPKFRSLFLPNEGEQWVGADYSQQEYRLVVHFACLLKLQGSEAAAAEYEKPDADFHQIVADLLGHPDDRKRMKNMNFGMVYGMQKNSLANHLGLEVQEAEPLLRLYHERAPFVSGLVRSCSNRAEEVGYVRTLSGRKCRFELWEPARYDRSQGRPQPLPREEAEQRYDGPLRRAYLHKAISRVVQGSGADIMKRAMAELYREGLTPLLTVHDELDYSSADSTAAELVKEVMTNMTQTRPAMRVTLAVGENWSEGH